MVTITETEAKKNIGKLWVSASQEPVTVESAGRPIAVVMSPEAYKALTSPHQPRKAGFAKELLAGVDVNALLAIPIDDAFSEYI